MLEVLKGAEITRHFNKIILRQSSDARRLMQLLESHGHEMHALNLCTLMHRLAKCLARGGPVQLTHRSRLLRETPGWAQLLKLVRIHAEDLNNMEITNCLWALATLEARGDAEEALALELAGLAMTHIESFEPRNLALSAWALGKLGYQDLTWCRRWASQVIPRLADFEPRDLTMVLWAFATVHWRDEAFLTEFCKEVQRKCEAYSPQDIGNTLWALATLAFRHEATLAAVSAECFKKAETFDQQNLSISMWSCATLNYKNMNLLHHITQLITERIKTFASQGIANTVWALAKFGFQQKCLLMTIAEDAIPRLDDYEPQHLSIVAWAYATLEFPNRPLLSALCQVAIRKMHIFSAQHMANMTWAMATLAHKDEEYLRALARRAVEQVATFNPQECSNLAWAFALLTFRDDELLAALSRRSQEIVAEFIPQNLGNTAWAYNRLGFRDPALMRCLAQQAARRLHECQGQEVLDLIEAITTGDYMEELDGHDWATLAAWSNGKYEGAKDFLDHHGSMPLSLPKLSEFDRALAVQDYREHLASFDLIGLGFTYTSQLLRHLGVCLPEGRAREDWMDVARGAAVFAGNESDVNKNQEAKEGLKACRTVCVYRFSLQSASGCLERGPVAITSGAPTEAHELGLFAATLRHHRGGDGEFQALQACARACLELGLPPLANGQDAFGEIWLHVSEVPCLSCVGAMAQFRQLFPNLRLNVTFTLGRQPAGISREPDKKATQPAGPETPVVLRSPAEGSSLHGETVEAPRLGAEEDYLSWVSARPSQGKSAQSFY